MSNVLKTAQDSDLLFMRPTFKQRDMEHRIYNKKLNFTVVFAMLDIHPKQGSGSSAETVLFPLQPSEEIPTKLPHPQWVLYSSVPPQS